ncbi:hypothetical protein Btru_051070 [Bulinus truncatus]|nr:hypothetical protein Btru_051070 [Bulinus truncatus]
MTVTIDDQTINLTPDCRHRLNSGKSHKLDVCTVHLNNPDVQIKILESDEEPRKFTTSCDSSELEISEGNNTFEVAYSDDCKRKETLKCILEGYVNVTGNKKNCHDCDEEDEATDWFFVLKWLLPTVVVIVSISTLIVIKQQDLLRTMSSHISVKGSRSQLHPKGSAAQLSTKNSKTIDGALFGGDNHRGPLRVIRWGPFWWR